MARTKQTARQSTGGSAPPPADLDGLARDGDPPAGAKDESGTEMAAVVPSSSAADGLANVVALDRTGARWKRRARATLKAHTSGATALTDVDNVANFGSEDKILRSRELTLGESAMVCCCTPLCAVGRCLCFTLDCMGEEDAIAEAQISLPHELATAMGQADVDDDSAAVDADSGVPDLPLGDATLYRKARRDLSGMPGFEMLSTIVEPNSMYRFWWGRYAEAGVRPPSEHGFILRDPQVNLTGPPRSYCIANSGGGVRAAAVSLGGWEALAADERLGMHRVEYVSTVSGGGYTGTAYLTHLAKLKHEARVVRARAAVAQLDDITEEEREMRMEALDTDWHSVRYHGDSYADPDDPNDSAGRQMRREQDEDKELKRRALEELAERMPSHGRYMSLTGQLATSLLGTAVMNLLFTASLAALLAVFADTVGVGPALRRADQGEEFFDSTFFTVILASSVLCFFEGLAWVGLSLSGDPHFLFQHLLPHGKVGVLLFGCVCVYASTAYIFTIERVDKDEATPFWGATVAWMVLCVAFHTARRKEFAARRRGHSACARLGLFLGVLPGAVASIASLALLTAAYSFVAYLFLVRHYSEDTRSHELRYLTAASLVGLALVHATMDIWVRQTHIHYRRALRNAFYARDASGNVYDPKVQELDDMLPTGPYPIVNATYNGFSASSGARENAVVDRNFGGVTFTPATFGSSDFGFMDWDNMETIGAQVRLSKVMALSGAAFGADFGRLSAKLSIANRLVSGFAGSGLGDWFPVPSPMNTLFDYSIRRFVNKWQVVVLGAVGLGVLLTSYSHWKWVVTVFVALWLLFFFLSLFNPSPPPGTGGFANRSSRYLRHLSPMVRLFHTTVLHSVAREAVPDDLSLTDGGHQENLGLVELLRRRRSRLVCFSGEGGPRFETLRKVIGAAEPFQGRRGLVSPDNPEFLSLAWLHHDLIVGCDVMGVHFLPPPGAKDPEDLPFSVNNMPTEMEEDGQPYYLFRLRYYIERPVEGGGAEEEDEEEKEKEKVEKDDPDRIVYPEGTKFPVDPVPEGGRPGYSTVDGWLLYVDKAIDPADPDGVERPTRRPHSRTFPDHPTFDQYSYAEEAFNAYRNLGRRNTEAALDKYGSLFNEAPPPLTDAVAAALHRRMWVEKVGVSPSELAHETPVVHADAEKGGV